MADTGGLTRVPRAVAHDCGVCGRRMGRTATRLLNEGRRSTAADADSTARCMPSPTRNVQCPAIFR